MLKNYVLCFVVGSFFFFLSKIQIQLGILSFYC